MDLHSFSYLYNIYAVQFVVSFQDNNKLMQFNTVLCLQAQLQDAKRRWEELNNFLHTVNAEREKIQASNQGDLK